MVVRSILALSATFVIPTLRTSLSTALRIERKSPVAKAALRAYPIVRSDDV
jgi:hypothetical protein